LTSLTGPGYELIRFFYANVDSGIHPELDYARFPRVIQRGGVAQANPTQPAGCAVFFVCSTRPSKLGVLHKQKIQRFRVGFSWSG